MATIRIGISGWTYAGWRGVFYPPKLPHRLELEHASAAFPSIEINGSFYSLQRASSWRAWRERSPPGFVFAVKGSRFITHMKRLRDVRPALANFFASGLLELGGKLGPLLWQLPARFRYDEERLESFLTLLPRSTADAARLAAEHDERVKDPGFEVRRQGLLRHALEVRHESFLCDELVTQLRRHNVALVVADTAGRFPFHEEVTASFLYLRLHGSDDMYHGSYRDDALDHWADRIRAWHRGDEPADPRRIGDCRPAPKPPGGHGRDVYVYFDNDVKAAAPADARRLMARLGVE